MTTAYDIISNLSIKMEAARDNNLEAETEFQLARTNLEKVSLFCQGIRLLDAITKSAGVLYAQYEIQSKEFIITAVCKEHEDYVTFTAIIMGKSLFFPVFSYTIYENNVNIVAQDIFNKIIGAYIKHVFQLVEDSVVLKDEGEG